MEKRFDLFRDAFFMVLCFATETGKHGKKE